MRNLMSTVVLSLLLVAPNAEVIAQEATRTVKDKSEMSETVMRVFSKEKCTLISEDLRDGYGAGNLAVIFRLRCEADEAYASAMLKELQSKEGLAVEKVALYPGSNSENKGPSVDIRFIAIVLAGIEG